MTEEETDWDAFTEQICRKIINLEKEIVYKTRDFDWTGDGAPQWLLTDICHGLNKLAIRLKTKDPIVMKEDLYSLETKELVEAFWNHHERKIEELEKENERLRLQISKKLI